MADRVTTLENNQRKQATVMARIEHGQRQCGEQLGVLSSALSELKDRDTSVIAQLQQIQQNFSLTGDYFNKWGGRIKEIEGGHAVG